MFQQSHSPALRKRHDNLEGDNGSSREESIVPQASFCTSENSSWLYMRFSRDRRVCKRFRDEKRARRGQVQQALRGGQAFSPAPWSRKYCGRRVVSAGLTSSSGSGSGGAVGKITVKA
eukprot:SAG11_NODE_143_length_14870_cov_6.472412_6_plen_118_part_00